MKTNQDFRRVSVRWIDWLGVVGRVIRLPILVMIVAPIEIAEQLRAEWPAIKRWIQTGDDT